VLNGAIVALEAIIQRSSGTNQLLWFMPTRDNPTAAAQFGPYAYRANAAQFFNLLWPVGLAVWWQQQFHREGRSQAHHWLLPCVMVLVSASLVSLSRGGVGIALFQLAACSLVLVFSRMSSLASKFVVLTGVALTVGAACYLGWNGLSERLQGDPLSGRGETYELAARMTKDYPWFGIGPGAFGSVFQFYRNSPQDYWPGQLHNDWLEILITFGWVGTLLLLAALAIVLFSWWKRSVGIRVPPGVAMLVMIALVGCLAHARFDFPLQIYSIQFVFVLWAAALIAMRGPKQSVSK
jgi:O-antigen ligase